MNAQPSRRRPVAPEFPWDDLHTVLAIAREGSLSGAARMLGVNHSTVSRRLMALELATGHTLFRRMPRGYAPTAAGEKLTAAAERIEAEVQGLVRTFSGQDIRLSGSVRLTSPDDIANHLLAGLLPRFKALYPDITVGIVIDNRMLNLGRREADIAIRATRSPPESLVGRRVAELAASVYAGDSLIAGRDLDTADLAALAKLPWIMWEEDAQPNLFATWLAKNCAHAVVSYRTSSLENQLAAAQAGLGLAVLPCFLGEFSPGLKRVLPPPAELNTSLWVLTHPDLRRAPRIAAMMEFLLAELPRHQALKAGTPAAFQAAS